MLGFKPWINGAPSDRSASCATTTARKPDFIIPIYFKFYRIHSTQKVGLSSAPPPIKGESKKFQA